MNREELIELLRKSDCKDVYLYVDNLFMGIEKVTEKCNSVIIVVRDPRNLEKELNNK